MVIDSKVIKIINDRGYTDANISVCVHKNKTYKSEVDKNIKIGISLNVSNEKSSDTFFEAKVIVVPSSGELLEGIAGEYFFEKAKIPQLVENPGGKLFLQGARNGYICLVHNLWVKPGFRDKEVIDELNRILIESIKDEMRGLKPAAIFLMKEDDSVEYKGMCFRFGFVEINARDMFLYTDYDCCEELVNIAIKINALKTQNGNVLVCRTTKSGEKFVETSFYDFVSEVYCSGLGQVHILNAVFNNTEAGEQNE